MELRNIKNNIPQLLDHLQHPHSLFWVVFPPKEKKNEHKQTVEQYIKMSSIFTVSRIEQDGKKCSSYLLL